MTSYIQAATAMGIRVFLFIGLDWTEGGLDGTDQNSCIQTVNFTKLQLVFSISVSSCFIAG